MIFYGIEAYAGDDLLLQLEDVTCDRHWMEQFVDKINLAGLSLFHLEDILADNLPYRIVENRCCGDEGDYTGFGIEAYDGEELLMQLKDVTCDRSWMEQFVKRINRGGLSPLHLYDVLIDCLP